MKERPILFSAPMVRALIDGSKTQTRRLVKGFALKLLAPDGFTPEYVALPENGNSPYGYAGDRLWVRETFFAYGRWETRYSEKKRRDEWHFVDMTLECDRVYQYAADNPDVPLAKGRGAMPGWWKRPAIFMPRAASRILPEMVSVRVERLNDISEGDAKAEGITPHEVRQFALFGATAEERAAMYRRAAVRPYCELWESINGADSWDANPFVWVIAFRRLTP